MPDKANVTIGTSSTMTIVMVVLAIVFVVLAVLCFCGWVPYLAVAAYIIERQAFLDSYPSFMAFITAILVCCACVVLVPAFLILAVISIVFAFAGAGGIYWGVSMKESY